MSARIARACLLAGGLLTLAPGAGAAEFYRYVDEQGVVHLTDVPTDPRFESFRLGPHRGTAARLIASRPSSRRYDPLIARAARRQGLPPALVKAVVRAESNFQPDAVSHKGAQGLMQLMPQTAAELGIRDPMRADQNLRGGTRYLRAMIDRFGDWRHALAAYNAGPHAVERYGGIPPYRETREYVDRVLHYYRRYDGDFVR